MIGIVSYGFYIPKYRIKTEELAKTWGKDPFQVKKSLSIEEKAVAYTDEDSLTMSYEASAMALDGITIDKQKIRAVFFGSETPPYVVNPTATILAEFLGIEGNYLAYDTQFACKAATSAMISALGLVSAGHAPYALVAAADKANAKPHDALEYTAASGAVSVVLGKDKVALEVVDFESFSSDTPDFWRREGIRYPSHGGRFTGKPSYFHHITEAAKFLLKKTRLTPAKFAHAVFHMPNGKFPQEVGLSLGFTKAQIGQSLTVTQLGNCYTASSLMGLVAVLETAKVDDLIFFASYGSGAGSDAFVFRVTRNISRIRKYFTRKLTDKKYIDYPTYLKYMQNI